MNLFLGNSTILLIDVLGMAPYIPKDRIGAVIFNRAVILGPGDIVGHDENLGISTGITNFALGIFDGLVFTCKCGWIDVGHARHAMDRALKFYQALHGIAAANGGHVPNGSLVKGLQAAKPGVGSIVTTAQINPPGIAQAAVNMAITEADRYEAHTPVNDFSYYSPEDLPSNLVGALAAGRALASLPSSNPSHADWVKKMDEQLTQVLKDCHALDKAAALNVFDKHVKDKWHTGSTLNKHNKTYDPINPNCTECKGVDRSAPKFYNKPDFTVMPWSRSP